MQRGLSGAQIYFRFVCLNEVTKNQNALMRQLNLPVEKPSLSDTASDWERLGHDLRSELNDQPLEATLTALRNLGQALKRGEWMLLPL